LAFWDFPKSRSTKIEASSAEEVLGSKDLT